MFLLLEMDLQFKYVPDNQQMEAIDVTRQSQIETLDPTGNESENQRYIATQSSEVVLPSQNAVTPSIRDTNYKPPFKGKLY